MDALRQEAVNPRSRLDEWLRPVVILVLTLGCLFWTEDPWSRVLLAIMVLAIMWDAAERRAQRRSEALIAYLEAKESLRKFREEHQLPDLD